MKTFLAFVFLLFLLILQLSFLPNGGGFRQLNLVFCYLVIYRFITKKFFLFYVISAGLLLDLFSMFPNGYYLIFFLFFGLSTDWILSRVSIATSMVNAAAALISGLLYQVEFLIWNQFLYWSKIVSWSIIFNWDYFFQVIFFIIGNGLVIFIFIQIYQTTKKPR
jgi:hypothetical protein